MYTTHTHTPAQFFKENRLRVQVCTSIFKFACISKQFISNRRSGSNNRRRMGIGQSLKRKGQVRKKAAFQTPRRSPSLLASLFWPLGHFRLCKRRFTSSMSPKYNTNIVMSSAYVECCAHSQHEAQFPAGSYLHPYF